MKKTLTDAKRRLIVNRCRERFASVFSPLGAPPQRSCLLWAALAADALNGEGIRAFIQAGTMSWPRIRPEEDDGDPDTFTHFSYVWGGSKTTKPDLTDMPEMHVWAATLRTQELIDLTTKYLPENCKFCTGADFTAPPPPDYFWGNVLPPGVLYAPDKEACLLSVKMMQTYLKERGLPRMRLY